MVMVRRRKVGPLELVRVPLIEPQKLKQYICPWADHWNALKDVSSLEHKKENCSLCNEKEPIHRQMISLLKHSSRCRLSESGSCC